MRNFFLVIAIILVLLGFFFLPLWIGAAVCLALAIFSAPSGLRADGKKKTGGAGKDKGKGGGGKDKFFLKAYLGASQAKGSLNVDFRTLDPTSSSFMAVAP